MYVCVCIYSSHVSFMVVHVTTLYWDHCVLLLQGSDSPTSTNFLLSDGVYATAAIPPSDTVLLWLGVSKPHAWELGCELTNALHTG